MDGPRAPLFALAVAALAAAPSSASASATVALDGTIGFLNVTGDDQPDTIQVTQSTSSMFVERTGGGLTALGDCNGGGAAVTCPRAAMVAVDLGGGNDVFS